MTILSKTFYSETDRIIKDYPKKVHALLPILNMAQKELGYLKIDTLKELASYLDITFTHILGVVTFYTMYSLKPRGSKYIGVCTNISCWLKGADELYEHIKEHLQKNFGEKFTDNFVVEKVECLGACGYAPVLLLDEHYQENANLDTFNKWLQSLDLK